MATIKYCIMKKVMCETAVDWMGQTFGFRMTKSFSSDQSTDQAEFKHLAEDCHNLMHVQ